MTEVQNAGLRLWQTQKAQGTGLCVGLDPHAQPMGDKEPGFYRQFVKWVGGQEALKLFRGIFDGMFGNKLLKRSVGAITAEFLAGLTAYYLQVIEAAWASGIRIYKPQAAFYEQFGPAGLYVLEVLCNRLHELAVRDGEMVFLILDCKRGDIDSTQAPYYLAYLTDTDQEMHAGMKGQYGFQNMTVTTWMGLDVLAPGLPLFRSGHGAIVVTRSSNPSGTTLQDAFVAPNVYVKLSAKQEPFRFTSEQEEEIIDIIGTQPMAHELMLWQTEKFSRDNGLNQDGVSPLFSVMGSTVEMLPSFRQLRPSGIALVPGFGDQGGVFTKIMRLHVKEGPLAGHLGILSSSRAHNFPWMKKYGGNDDPQQLKSEMARMIDQFRIDEKAAYVAAGLDYPF